MNRPSLVTRMAGSPVGASLLMVGYAATVFAWYEQQVSWWEALAAVGMAWRTLRAVRRLRRYKAWAAEWDAIGEKDKPARPEMKKRRWMVILSAVLLFVAIPLCAPQLRDSEGLAQGLMWLWLIVCLYFVWKLFAWVRRNWLRSTARASARRQDQEDAAPVEWVMSRASSSPSRAEATRALPEYCARMNMH